MNEEIIKGVLTEQYNRLGKLR